MAEATGILLGGEVTPDGKVAAISYELLGIGRRLADKLGEALSIVVMGDGLTDALGEELIAGGADTVYMVNDPLFRKYEYHPDPYLVVMERLIREAQPNIFLMGRTELGQDLAPALAFRLDTGLGMDCLDLDIDPETNLLVITRPVYGGNARATYLIEHTRPQMATIRPKTQDPSQPDAARTGSIEYLDADLDDAVFRTQFVSFQQWQQEGVQLETAEIVVSGGRGIGSAEAYQETIEVCAAVLGGAAGSSKAGCDAGYAPPGNQVGLTGKRVSPKLYVAIAISGASQHLAGMGTSKCIVAINKDPDANMFKVARYGIVADYKQVMPAFIEACRDLVGQR
ncbi:MAG: electron transfer flavoprotein subunit alpha/FixB family protein [Chloroflexi bacterium]|nr:electron transfer flavoprotein subunit alpha/FixB family protein [Chloroflexota bacterium]